VRAVADAAMPRMSSWPAEGSGQELSGSNACCSCPCDSLPRGREVRAVADVATPGVSSWPAAGVGEIESNREGDAPAEALVCPIRPGHGRPPKLATQGWGRGREAHLAARCGRPRGGACWLGSQTARAAPEKGETGSIPHWSGPQALASTRAAAGWLFLAGQTARGERGLWPRGDWRRAPSLSSARLRCTPGSGRTRAPRTRPAFRRRFKSQARLRVAWRR
jgi:hypothetical protein